jgi:hypothetical protein
MQLKKRASSDAKTLARFMELAITVDKSKT